MKHDEKDKLLSLDKRDFEVQTFKSTGKGGQHRNKTESAVRIIHRASGAVGVCDNERSQVQNKRTAFERLVASDRFQKWLKIENARALDKLMGRPHIKTHAEIEADVKKQMEKDLQNGDIKIEVQNMDGEWVEA